MGNCLDTAFNGTFWSNLFLMNEWVQRNKTVTLKLHVSDTCTFLKSKEYFVESPTKHVTTSTGFFGRKYTKEVI